MQAALDEREARARKAELRAREISETAIREKHQHATAFAKLAGERDDMKRVVLSTLRRLERVEGVVTKQDQTKAIMMERLKWIEEEKEKALNIAAASREDARLAAADLERMRHEIKVFDALHKRNVASKEGRDSAMRGWFESHPSMTDKLKMVMGDILEGSGSGSGSGSGNSSDEEGKLRWTEGPPIVRSSDLHGRI